MAGDPLADVAVLESVGFVMKGGVVVKNELGNQLHLPPSRGGATSLQPALDRFLWRNA